MTCTLSRHAGTSALLLTTVYAPVVVAQTREAADHTRLFFSETANIAGPAVLSPDGRWLAFSITESPSTATLAVTRVGSDSVRHLTTVGRWDSNPEWSRSGSEIYFVSNRLAQVTDRSYYGMVLSFDTRSGRATGEPRRVTNDPVAGFLRVSPDGKSLAYVDAGDRRLLKVMPAAGGTSRVVTRMPPRSPSIAWSRDGQHLYFITSVPHEAQRVLHRVPVNGGEPVVVSRNLPPEGRLTTGPGAETFLAEDNRDGPRDGKLKLIDQTAKVLDIVAVKRGTRATQIMSDGRSMIAVEANVVAPTRIMSIEGGSFRDVTAPVTYDWVMSWSPDGSSVYTWTEQDGKGVLAEVPVAGGAPKVIPESREWSAHGANSRYLFQATPRVDNKPRSLVAIDLRDSTRHMISESLPGHRTIFPYGPGGTWAAHDELYFFERHGDRLDVKAWRGPNDVRTLRSLPASALARTNVAVHGDRVVWQQERGDSLDALIADGAEAQPRRLLTMPMMTSNEISFSNDGGLLVLHYTRGPGAPDLMAFVDPSGKLPLRIVDTGLSYWYWPRWLPDNSAVLVVGGGVGYEADVIRIPVAEGAKPVNVTRSDPTSKWGFEVSPDGRFIAYPAEISKGSSVWQIDIGRGRQLSPGNESPMPRGVNP